MVPDASGKNPGGVRGARHRLRGPSRIDVAAPAVPRPTAAKKRVLFVCIGNSCRSQMAEAFAEAYGTDIMEVQSAGVSPATYIAPLTKQTLGEWNLNIDDHFPKSVDSLRGQPFDVVLNMSGTPLRMPGTHVIDWVVPDPIGQSEAYYRTVATQIEGLVMRLILELRTAK
ncbi:MAG TPA: arsenate reductase ArsC [Bryobacteraceae bacterium]|nr:arsenate reductase ArsC [Bryobacteraceae bacterium]